MNGRGISSSVARALLVLISSCAGAGPASNSGVTNAPNLTPGDRCRALGSDCAISSDCCSQLCQNGECVEQSGM